MNEGGPAFPEPIIGEGYNVVPSYREKGGFRKPFPGMTLRDYFAAKIAAEVYAVSDGTPDKAHGGWQYIAQAAYEIADAMLEEREKRR